MIILDTHIWVWWVHGDSKLSEQQRKHISENEQKTIGISTISCWEIAKLVEYQRLILPCDIEEWFNNALSYPGNYSF